MYICYWVSSYIGNYITLHEITTNWHTHKNYRNFAAIFGKKETNPFCCIDFIPRPFSKKIYSQFLPGALKVRFSFYFEPRFWDQFLIIAVHFCVASLNLLPKVPEHTECTVGQEQIHLMLSLLMVKCRRT